MKATTIIIAAVLSLQVNLLIAGNNETSTKYNSDLSNISLNILAPVTPEEADFSDIIPEPILNKSNLAPVTPSEADFNDSAPEAVTNDISLAPETPSVADFDENETNLTTLAPVTPAEADFE